MQAPLKKQSDAYFPVIFLYLRAKQAIHLKSFVMTDQTSPDKLHIGLTILSFLFPIVGIIIFFMNRNTLPNKARTGIIAAIAGMILLGVGYTFL